MTRAVAFDVDFTLIRPGPVFQGAGYQVFCSRYGIIVDASLFDSAVASASALLHAPDDAVYDEEIFVGFTRHIIERMGGRGALVDACAREIYAEWAACHHFELYEEVPIVLRHLADAGVIVGLVSNSHRCLASFESHFALEGLIAAAVSSAEHGRMKPHPSIFRALLARMGVDPHDALMIGDSVIHDVEGALGVGMRAALLHRDDVPHPRARELSERGVPTLRTLRDLLPLVHLPPRA
ncbi:MAG: HAD family hydrolase [Vicinamibacterales bacterium]